MARGFVCPVCGKEKRGYPAEAVTICETCGTSIKRTAPRLLLIGKVTYHTFCSPECLKRYAELDELYSKMGSRREKE